MFITLKNSSVTPISFTGVTQITPYKFNRVVKKTLAGSTREMWTDIYNKINMTIYYLSGEDYEIFKRIWAGTENIQLITERGETFSIVYFTNPDLNLTLNYDYAGNIYYTGVLDLEE